MGKRIIKFRAWDNQEKEMIDGSRHKSEDYDEYWCDVFGLQLNAIEQINRNPRFEVMQFTGLLDKNGKEIYESDIVRCFDTAGEMVYDHVVDFFEFRKEIWSEEHEGRTKVEIIGNIYEHPELLRKPL